MAFLADKIGQQSSMRLVMVAGTLIILVVWGIISVKQNQLLDMPDNILWLIGALLTGKVSQKFIEEKEKKCIDS